MKDSIVLKGVSTHNLKGIDIKIPKNKITTITGVSGSGKSSLAFDTLYKEGQFRYIESLSSYLRQFFNLGTRPELEYSEGLSPAIAIEQNKRVGNIRSMVGTLTEIDDYIRLLFAKLGTPFCYSCGEEIKVWTSEQILEDINKKFKWEKIYFIKELQKYTDQDVFQKYWLKNRRRVDRWWGFIRFLIKLNNWDFVEYFYLEEPNIPEKFFPIEIFGIYDRISINKSNSSRVHENIVKILSEDLKFGVVRIQKQDWGHIKKEDIYWYTDKNFCAQCNIAYPEFQPQHFSPNRAEGACEVCLWIGETLQVNMDLAIDENAPLYEAILPWRESNLGKAILDKLTKKYGISGDIKRKSLPDWFKDIVLNWDDELLRLSYGGKYISIRYRGIEDVLRQQYQKGFLTVEFQSLFSIKTCPACGGARLKKESLNVFLLDNDNKKYNIWDLQNMHLEALLHFLKNFKSQTNAPKQLLDRILNPLIYRLEILVDLWLWYLTSSRRIDTLSWWEIQRLRLAKQLGNRLSGIVYVLDEPTIGLSPIEIKKVIEAIKELAALGNTIVVVEHNEDFIVSSDWIIEIGPGAWDFGGEVVFEGSLKEFLKTDTLTAQYLRGDKQIDVNFAHKPTSHKISIRGAKIHNLQNINIDFPVGGFTIITGPSGAGKTSLMYDTLFRFVNDKEKYIQSFIRLSLLKKGYSLGEILEWINIPPAEYEHLSNIAIQSFLEELKVDYIGGLENIKNVVYIDQSSIGKTPRSCPATFIWVFDEIRKLFAASESAKMFGFTSSFFSFNSSKWACSACNGYGYKKVELQFLPDTYVPCEVCHGKRYKSEVLQVKWQGKTIADILEMYVDDAYELFKDIPSIEEKLKLMIDIGLGYLKMGQPAHTLSWWESQRLKLVKNLLKKFRSKTLYFLDEPTVGLHPADIEKLLKILAEFLKRGDTILMIEHDKNLLKYADQVIWLENGKIVDIKSNSKV